MIQTNQQFSLYDRSIILLFICLKSKCFGIFEKKNYSCKNKFLQKKKKERKKNRLLTQSGLGLLSVELVNINYS